ncbi:hypothetical protein P7F88_00900 [Vibrio hannami]|uniref:hypothetical protein n=1 Tax=Vibrio hannami TaxID=2717094 RepID=UPI00240FBF85|nr:hypothetical protein [Vibrio hannami]MDG3084723.1 hypothetical protein [Vibrio hannami]
MNMLKMTSIISGVALITACSTVGDKMKIPEKGTASIALQITKSAGSGTVFEDRKVPESALNDVSAAGYVGYSALGVALSNGVLGFGLALLGDQKFGWDGMNYIMYLDADKYDPSDIEAVGNTVMSRMVDIYPNSLELAKSLTPLNISENDYIDLNRNNGGQRLFVRGYNGISYEKTPACIRYSRDKCVIGSWLNIVKTSKPIDISLFSDELQDLMPSSSVIAVRFYYFNSHYQSVYVTSKNNETINRTDSSYPSSPEFRLPESTFISFPEKFILSETKYLPYISAIRDNNNVYYFAEPINKKQLKSPIADFHEQYVKMVSNTE